MTRRAPLAAVLAALALVAAGCTSSSSGGGDTSDDFKGAQRDVAATIEDLQSAGSKGDQDEICSRLLASALVDRLEARGGCRKVVDAALDDVDTSDLKVESVRVAGTTATAAVTTDTGDRTKASRFALVRQDGRWRISGLGDVAG
jgi:hypothetical protein